MPTRGTACMVVVGGVRAIVLTVTLDRPAILGLIRGATVGLIVGTRESMWRLGVRMMLCAWTGETCDTANSAAATVTAVLIREFLTSRTIEPLALSQKRGPPYGVSTARLTIFSFCSRPSSAATSFLPIALLPNCTRNMPSVPPPTIDA